MKINILNLKFEEASTQWLKVQGDLQIKLMIVWKILKMLFNKWKIDIIRRLNRMQTKC